VVWLLALIMVVHGLIHLMGGLSQLGLAKIPGLAGHTIVPLHAPLGDILGVAWLLAVPLFLVAAAALLTHHGWWRPLAVAAVVLSQILIVIWWPEARWGTVANALVVVGAVLA